MSRLLKKNPFNRDFNYICFENNLKSFRVYVFVLFILCFIYWEKKIKSGKLENSLLLKLLNLLARNSNSDSNLVKVEFERSIMDLIQEPR